MGKAFLVMLIVLLTATTMFATSKRFSKKQRRYYIQKLQNGTKISMPCKHDCPRGQELRKKCSKHKDAKCSKCKDGTFSSHKSKRCRPCKLCKKGYYAEKECSAVTNTKCVKIHFRKCSLLNFLSINATILDPKKRGKCLHRFEKSQRISPRKVYNVTKVKTCGKDYYLRRIGGNYSCTPCTSCKANETLLRQCTWKQDAVCGDCKLGYYRDNSTGLCQKCSLCYGRALGIDVKDEVVKECKQHKKSPLFRCMPVISFITTSTEESSLSETSQEDIFVDYENFFASSMKESQQPNLQLIFNIIIGLLSFILVFLISMLFLCKFTLSRRKKKERNICLTSSVTKIKHREKDMPFILHRYIQDIKESGAQSIQNCSEPGYLSSPFTYIDDGDTPYTDGDRIGKRRKEKMNEIHRNSHTFMFDSRKVDELNGNMSCDFHKNDVYCIST